MEPDQAVPGTGRRKDVLQPPSRAGRSGAAVAGFATLFFVLCGHSILETARDALFLRSLPVGQLPWVYLIIAALTFAVAAVESRVAGVERRRFVLGPFLALAALVTAGLWAMADFVSIASLWALYVWTGLFATLSATYFWLSLGAAVTVTEAKRLFGVVAAGALVGAICGAAVARWIVTVAHTRGLVALSAAMMLVGAIVAQLALRPAVRRLRDAKVDATAPPSARVPAREALASLKVDPYARLVVSFVFATTVALTLVDFVFKREVAESIDPEALGSFFATFYVGANTLALLVQLVLVRWLIDRIGVHRGLCVLPSLLVAGGAWAALGSGLSAVLLLKGADGALRHSLHRTATEILFVPLSGAARNRVKKVSDVIGHRGGQAFGSVLILVGASALEGEAWIAWGVVAVAASAAVVALRSRKPYLDVFRRRLGAEPDRTVRTLPPLDRSALEAIATALESPHEPDVLAALEVLREQDRVDLVPVRVLRHESARVVTYALDCLVEAGRADLVPAALRLLDDSPADVRAALLRAIGAVSPDERVLLDALNEPSARVRATAIVTLCALGRIPADDARRRLRDTTDQPAVRRAIGAVLAVRPCPALSDLLAELAADEDRTVRAEAIAAIAASGEPRLWPVLLASLRERGLRPLARRGLLDGGEAALTFLIEALEAEDLPLAIRLHVPRSLCGFDSDRAASALVARLGAETDLRVRHKIVRALGRLAHTRPALVFDRARVTAWLVATIGRCRRLAEWRRALTAAIAERPERDTASGAVLGDMVLEELTFELEQVFRGLALLDRGEDFESIHRGFESEDPYTRASSHELLREILPHADADTLLRLLRSLRGGDVEDGPAMSGDAALAEMVAGRSEAIAAMTAAYAAEVGALDVCAHIEARRNRGTEPELAPVFERAVRRLSPPGDAVA